MTIEPYLDELQDYADKVHRVELLAARVEYFAGLGRMNEDDELFEAHLDRFLDWFLFERIIPQTGRTILDNFLESAETEPERQEVFRGFSRNVHSLFVVRRSKEDGIHLRDMLSQQKYFARVEIPGAFTKGQPFEARLLPLGEEWYFSKGYIFHPLTALKAIEKRIKKLDPADAFAPRALIRDLAIRRLKADRYKHINPEQFYQF